MFDRLVERPVVTILVLVVLEVAAVFGASWLLNASV